MNERFKELAIQVMHSDTEPHLTTELYSFTKSEFEKFAELIVRECIEKIEFQYGGGNLMEDGETHNPEWDNAIECVSAMIKQHFGVEP